MPKLNPRSFVGIRWRQRRRLICPQAQRLVGEGATLLAQQLGQLEAGGAHQAAARRPLHHRQDKVVVGRIGGEEGEPLANERMAAAGGEERCGGLLSSRRRLHCKKKHKWDFPLDFLNIV